MPFALISRCRFVFAFFALISLFRFIFALSLYFAFSLYFRLVALISLCQKNLKRIKANREKKLRHKAKRLASLRFALSLLRISLWDFICLIKSACPSFAKPDEIKLTKVFSFQECDQIISVLEDLLKLVEVGVTVPPPRPPSPSSESESDSETDPDQRKERDTGIGSRETESSDIMDVMKRFMATLNS